MPCQLTLCSLQDSSLLQSREAPTTDKDSVVLTFARPLTLAPHTPLYASDVSLSTFKNLAIEEGS